MVRKKMFKKKPLKKKLTSGREKSNLLLENENLKLKLRLEKMKGKRLLKEEVVANNDYYTLTHVDTKPVDFDFEIEMDDVADIPDFIDTYRTIYEFFKFDRMYGIESITNDQTHLTFECDSCNLYDKFTIIGSYDSKTETTPAEIIFYDENGDVIYSSDFIYTEMDSRGNINHRELRGWFVSFDRYLREIAEEEN